MRCVSANPRSAVQDDRTTERKPLNRLLQPLVIDVIGHTAAGVFQDLPYKRHGASTIDDREAHQTVRVPSHGGLPGQIDAMLSPLGEGLLQQGAIEGMHGDPLLFKPTGQPTHGALRVHRSAVPIGGPGGETDLARLNEAHHHAGQRLEMPQLHPVLLLASHLP